MSAPGWRTGRRLGIDVGDVRVGVATCDPHGMLATPVETVPRGRGDVERICDLADEYDVIEVVVGLPRLLSGKSGTAVEKTTAFAQKLQATARTRGRTFGVRLVDERLTTVSAERVLRERGKDARARRSVVDQAAAVVILQHAIDTERARGEPNGYELEVGE